MASISQISYYPVKALSAQKLSEIDMVRGKGLPGDRRFALAIGSIDLGMAQWRPKSHFVTLKRHEKLAALSSQFDQLTGVLTIRLAGSVAVSATIASDPNLPGSGLSKPGVAEVNSFLADYLGREVDAHLVDAVDGHFCDRPEPFVSIINKASVDHISRLLGRNTEVQSLSPLRFRGNLLVDGWEAWSEMAMIGRQLTVGSTRLKVVETIGRCAATDVNPLNATRDSNIVKGLQRGVGHTICGLYAIVEKGGTIAIGDPVVGPA